MKRLSILVLIALLLPVQGHADERHSMEGKFTRHYAESLFKVTENGLFSIEMLILGRELKIGINAVDIIIHDAKDHDVLGAEITVTPWMPEMGHGVSEKPAVMERGGGLYSIENIVLTMGGLWDLRVKVKRGDDEDTAVFSFPDVHAAGTETHEHKPAQMEVPEGLNVSHIRMSTKGTFRVAFISDRAPVPVNRVHGWSLYVETADGVPITDAEITISGDMPEHGHGLPTKPSVARNMGDGVYAVEGMKFQMPGWWVVVFTVDSGNRRDKVTFNLMLK